MYIQRELVGVYHLFCFLWHQRVCVQLYVCLPARSGTFGVITLTSQETEQNVLVRVIIQHSCTSYKQNKTKTFKDKERESSTEQLKKGTEINANNWKSSGSKAETGTGCSVPSTPCKQTIHLTACPTKEYDHLLFPKERDQLGTSFPIYLSNRTVAGQEFSDKCV